MTFIGSFGMWVLVIVAVIVWMGLNIVNEYQRLVVFRLGRLVGIVTLDDLVRCLGREMSNLVEGIKHEMEVK